MLLQAESAVIRMCQSIGLYVGVNNLNFLTMGRSDCGIRGLLPDGSAFTRLELMERSLKRNEIY